MLLVEAPDQKQLLDVVERLIEGSLAREEVASWQKAVFNQNSWDIPIPETEGYWYFYSLSFIELPFPGGYFLRERDLVEYVADMMQVPGEALSQDLLYRRSWQLDQERVRWPLAIIRDDLDIMSRMPGCRGTFEKRMDMVEHCHLGLDGDEYLLVKQFDERASQVLLLGSSRDRKKAEHLVKGLSLDSLAVNYL